jgi:hypothetical protein
MVVNCFVSSALFSYILNSCCHYHTLTIHLYINTGAVYIFSIDAVDQSIVTQNMKLLSKNMVVGGKFGHSVAMNGNELVVGEVNGTGKTGPNTGTYAL